MSEKKTNLDVLASLIQRIAGSEAGDRPEMTIKLAIKELKKNKRLDPELTKQLKRAKIVDIEAEKRGTGSNFENPQNKPILEDEEVVEEQEAIPAEKTEVAEAVESALVAEELAFADSVLPVDENRPAEGWWDWTWKKLNFEPTTLSWTDIAMNELGQMRGRRLAALKARKMKAAAPTTSVESAEVEGETLDEAHLDKNGMVVEDEWGENVWDVADEAEYDKLIGDIDDNEFDAVEGMTYSDMHAWMDNMSPEEFEMIHDAEIDDIVLSPEEEAEIEAEADRIAKAEIAREFGVDDYDAEIARLDGLGYGSNEIFEAASEAQIRKNRMAIGRRMRRMSKIMSIKRQRKMKRAATLPELMKRSIRRAREFWKEKLSRTHSASEYAAKPFNFRRVVEKKLEGKKAAIARLARKWLKDVRADDRQRRMQMNAKAMHH